MMSPNVCVLASDTSCCSFVISYYEQFPHLQRTSLNTPSHLRWCPMGPFAFLPIHAASTYDIWETDCVFDYVILSYTPTNRGFSAI